MATSKIKKDDLVQVITGKDKGKTGKVLSVDTKNNKVLVEGVNMVSKHSKPSMTNQQGGIIEMEAPIDLSNVMYVHKGKPVRIGFQGEKKDKVRVAKVNGKLEKIDEFRKEAVLSLRRSLSTWVLVKLRKITNF